MRIDPLHVESAEDPRASPYAQLTDMELRLRVEHATGVFIAEGMLVIERCVAAGLEVVSVLTARRWLDRLDEILHDEDIDVYVAEADILRSITGFHVHRGALAVVRRPASRTVDELLVAPGDILVLEGLVDATNVGLAFRSAVAQGIDAVVLSPDCADPLYRRAVKSSMGAVVRCRWARSTDWPATMTALIQSRAVVALGPAGDEDLATVLADYATQDIAMVLGSEGPGITESTWTTSHRRARIPMASPGDSLNVAAAAAVACYARHHMRIIGP